jgi:hypothetical protein
VINRIAFKILRIIAACIVTPLLLIAGVTFFVAAGIAGWVNLLNPNEGR